jgi:hypothetical protein
VRHFYILKAVVLKVRDPGAGSRFPKSEFYSVFQGTRKFDPFGERNATIHAQQRKLISRIYAMESLKSLEPFVGSTVSTFVRRMKEFEGQSVDLDKWFQLFAFGGIAFSKTIQWTNDF